MTIEELAAQVLPIEGLAAQVLTMQAQISDLQNQVLILEATSNNASAEQSAAYSDLCTKLGVVAADVAALKGKT